MRRAPVLVVAAAAGSALLAAGCGAEDVQQAEARLALERHIAGSSEYTGEAHCTGAAKVGYFVEQPTSRFVCAGRRTDGSCDWFRVTFRDGGEADIALDRRNGGCTLPG